MVLEVMTVIIPGKVIVATQAQVRLLGSIPYLAMEYWLHRYIHVMDIHCDIRLDLSTSLNIIFINKN